MGWGTSGRSSDLSLSHAITNMGSAVSERWTMVWAECRTMYICTQYSVHVSRFEPWLRARPPPTDRVSQPVDRIPAATNQCLLVMTRSEE